MRLKDLDECKKRYSGSRIESCIPVGTSHIMAMELDRNVKLFTKWYEEKYMKGEKGDYIVYRGDDPQDFYIIRRDIFDITYSPE